MNKKKKSLAVVLTAIVMSGALFACGVDEETAENETTEEVTEATTAEVTSEEVTEAATEATSAETDYSAGTSQDAATVEAFAAKVKSTVESSDWDALIDMAEYPVMVSGTEVATKDELRSKIEEKGVSEAFISAIKNENCVGMMANGQGVMMADGEVWFRDSLDGSGLVIISFNGLLAE